MGLAHGELVALAAHGLDEHREVHDAPALDLEGVRAVGGGELQRHVPRGGPLQAREDLAAGDVVAFLAREGRVVDVEHHRDGGLVEGDGGQGLHVLGVAQRVADAKLLHAGHDGDVAAEHLLGRDSLEALVAEELLRQDREGLLAVGVDEGVAAADLQAAAAHAPHGDPAEEVIMVEGRGLELDGAGRVHGRRGDVLEDLLEQRLEVVGLLGGILRGPAVTARSVDHGELELLVAGAELDEQVEDLVQDLLRARVGAVNLVDHHERLEVVLERLAKHEARLRHGAFEGVHQQQHGVRHVERPLDLPAEVGVSRRVDDVDAGPLVGDRRVLGEDGDAALALLIVGVQGALSDHLVVAEGAGIAEHRVHQRGLAMVDVGDDGQVSNLGGGRHRRGGAALPARAGRGSRGQAARGGSLQVGAPMDPERTRRARACARFPMFEGKEGTDPNPRPEPLAGHLGIGGEGLVPFRPP